MRREHEFRVRIGILEEQVERLTERNAELERERDARDRGSRWVNYHINKLVSDINSPLPDSEPPTTEGSE